MVDDSGAGCPRSAGNRRHQSDVSKWKIGRNQHRDAGGRFPETGTRNRSFPADRETGSPDRTLCSRNVETQAARSTSLSHREVATASNVFFSRSNLTFTMSLTKIWSSVASTLFGQASGMSRVGTRSPGSPPIESRLP